MLKESNNDISCTVYRMRHTNAYITFLKECGRTLLDLLFPLHERERRVARLTPDALSVSPVERDGIVTLMPYTDALVRDTIRALKYKTRPEAARLCADVLHDYLVDACTDASLLETYTSIYVVPVPLGKRRLRERGHNQVRLVLDQLPKGSDLYTVRECLVRIRETKKQTTLSRRERLENVSGAFACIPETPSLANTLAFLIDDVSTTGATLTEAALPLKRAGATVHPVALARAYEAL